jgi:4-nitrophenyl phosphatase
VTGVADARGVVFDLDGCVWRGKELTPGASELIDTLARAGCPVAFLTNNSRATARDIHARLAALGVAARADRVLTPLEILGHYIRERHGVARVLVMGAAEMTTVIQAAGHAIVGFDEYADATVVAVGNDFELSYARLTAAARAVAAGAALVTPNVDPRLPVEDDDFLPGCGAIVEAVAIAGMRRPEIVGKPEPPLFQIALDRLGVAAPHAVMVGDSVASDIQGARRVGMRTVLFAPAAKGDAPEADLTVHSFAELRQALLGSDGTAEASSDPPRLRRRGRARRAAGERGP